MGNVKPAKLVVPIGKFPRTSTKYSTYKVKITISCYNQIN